MSSEATRILTGSAQPPLPFNIVPNSGFEDKTANWSVTGGSFTTTTTFSNVGRGIYSAQWTPPVSTAAGVLLQTDSIEIPAGLYGRDVTASILVKGNAATNGTMVLDVFDGTTVLSSVVISNSTNYTKFSTSTFSCPTSGSVRIRVRTTATTPANTTAVYFDEVFFGAPYDVITILPDDSITTAKIVNDAVTFAKIQNISNHHIIGRHSGGSGDPELVGIDGGLEFNGANIRRSALTGDVTASAGSGSTTIANDAVTTAKIANGAVTQAKRAALGQQISSLCSFFSTSSTTSVNVTNLSVTITTTGRPVFLSLEGSGASDSRVLFTSGDVFVNGTVEFVRDSTIVSSLEMYIQANPDAGILTVAYPSSTYRSVDTPAAGTYTYVVRVKNLTSGLSIEVVNCRLLAFEL